MIFEQIKKKISAQNYNSLRGMLDKKNDDAQGEKVLSALVQRAKKKKQIFTKKKKKHTPHFVSFIL